MYVYLFVQYAKCQYSYVLYLPTRVMLICPCSSINSRSHRTEKIWLSGLFTQKDKLITSVFLRHCFICDFETSLLLNTWFLYYTLRFGIIRASLYLFILCISVYSLCKYDFIPQLKTHCCITVLNISNKTEKKTLWVF